MRRPRRLRDLRVYRRALAAASHVAYLARRFPWQEDLGLTRQVLNSSRSVCANLGEAWRKRRYAAAFVAKISDAQAEAEETGVHLEIACRCGYLTRADLERTLKAYDRILAELEVMARHPERWAHRTPERSRSSPVRKLWDPARGKGAGKGAGKAGAGEERAGEEKEGGSDPQGRESGRSEAIGRPRRPGAKEQRRKADERGLADEPLPGGVESARQGDERVARSEPLPGGAEKGGQADERGARSDPRPGAVERGSEADEDGVRREPRLRRRRQ